MKYIILNSPLIQSRLVYPATFVTGTYCWINESAGLANSVTNIIVHVYRYTHTLVHTEHHFISFFVHAHVYIYVET